MKILFLSASVGVGHLSAANAVGAALRALDPNAETPVIDSYKYAALVVSRVVSDGYLRMVKTIPQMYRYIYDRAERATEVGRFAPGPISSPLRTCVRSCCASGRMRSCVRTRFLAARWPNTNAPTATHRPSSRS